MKNIIFYVGLTASLLIGYSIDSHSQFILAGQHNSSNYFYDIIPDTSLTGPNNHATSDPPAVYRIDINGDGVLDFYLYAVGFWSNGMGNTTIAIKSYDTSNNQIAYGYYDTCYYVYTDTSIYFLHEIAKSLEVNDSINNKLEWSNNIGLYLAYTNWMLMVANCEGNGFSNDPPGNHIAVRICQPNDTLYGWIKVTNINYLTFTVQEFACSKTFLGIEEQDESIKIFPIPTHNNVEIETRFSDYDLFVYNQDGLELVKKKNTSRKTQIQLGNQPAGVYVVKIVKDNTVIVKKILKQ